ncbi:beta-ketoacyl synthase domain-containing protein [Rutstroemia sp. NJR-2017a WRK4]|nr:beta-ketoacyl synthase domain-containing protein [Rutstroemia sp. NJR-2017a WRK4]
MVIGTPGALDTLHFVDSFSEEVLEDYEIEIEVKAIGINPADIMAATGEIESDSFGCECSGVVNRIGSNVTSLATGDRVVGISMSPGGVYSTFVRSNSEFFFKVPDGTSFEAAASIPIAYCSAYYGLHEVGRVTSDDTVMIHGATSALGQAAINFAQSSGAKVFSTVGNTEQKEFLEKKYGLTTDQIIVGNNGSFDSNTLQQTHLGRFDLILNCASADTTTMREISAWLHNFGRFIDLVQQKNLGKLVGGNNRTCISVDMNSVGNERPQILRRLISQISECLTDHKILPPSYWTFSISEIESAFKKFQSGSIDGKLIISPGSRDMVKATPSSKSSQILRPDAAYILIGGTGGLGRSMARWMVTKGASHLVLISRSGSATGKVKELVDELTTLGANVLVRKCDVARKDSVDNLLSNELDNMPPVRGVVHGAMVLRDVLFEKMTYEEYTTVIESKVEGAWNFHHALKSQQLDFFVAISSAAGAVGNRGQAAYSAANTFLNAFVQHRLSLGLPASSLDLTAISDVGYLAEDAEAAAEVMKNLGSDTICEAEVLALLGAAITGKLSTCNNHTITGMRITTPPPFWTNDSKFKHLRLAAEAAQSDGQADVNISFNTLLKSAQSLEEAQDVVCKGLLHKLPSVLMLEAEDMDVTRSLSNYNLDSLVAIEVRNFIAREFEANLQVLELLSSGSIETLAKAICGKSKLVALEME